MGLFSGIKKAFKKVSRVIRGNSPEANQAPVNDPTPAPEIGLANPEGEAEEKKETEKITRRKGKRALKISKNATPVSSGRNIV